MTRTDGLKAINETGLDESYGVTSPDDWLPIGTGADLSRFYEPSDEEVIRELERRKHASNNPSCDFRTSGQSV